MSKVSLIEEEENQGDTGFGRGVSNNDDQKSLHVLQEKGLTVKPTKTISKLRKLRKMEGYTLEQLSKLTNISPSYLSRLEAGDRRLNTDLIQRLSEVFACSPADLLQDTVQISGGGLSAHYSSVKAGQFQKDLPIYKMGPVKEVGNIPVDEETGQSSAQYLYLEDPVDWAYRPVQLAQVPSAFAVYLTKPHSSPKYDERDLLLVHPSKPLTKDCAALAIKQDDSVILGQFEGWKGEMLILTSYSSVTGAPRELILNKSKLKAVYRIIGTLESPE